MAEGNVITLGALQREFTQRARTAGVEIDCLGDGNVNANTAIVAEAPGEYEVRLRTPLVGGSGQFLWERLRKLGITRKDTYITNVCKRKLVTGTDKEKLGGGELVTWRGLLEWELQCLPNVRYILVLGSMALEALCGRYGIDDWRGSVLELEGIQYIITNNPAAVMRTPHLEHFFRLDLYKLKMCMDGTYVKHEVVPYFDPSPSEAIAFARRMRDERKPVSVDIEIIANETACIGLANDPHFGMCINFRNVNRNRFSVAEEVAVRREIAALFADKEARFVTQNGNFDAYWLWYKDRLRIHRIWFDTLLAHHALYPSLPHDLGFLTTQYTTHPYYKNERTLWREDSEGRIEDFWVYNVKDVCVTHAVHTAEHRELVDQKLDKLFFNHVMRAHPWITQMTACGVLLDENKRREFDTYYAAHVENCRTEFYHAVAAATGDATYQPNPNSPPAIRSLLFNKLQVVGKGYSTDDTNRTHILNNPKTPLPARNVIRALNVFKKEHKFFSTYVQMKVDPDSRIRCEFKQFGTQSAPGRLSSSRNMWGSGMNMQNQPPKAREMIIADEGYTFGYYDLSQAEARFVGWDAKIDKWKEQFERARIDGKFDCHRALCAEMFKMNYEDTPEKDTDGDGNYTKRYIAKRCRHGLNYRMGPDRLAEVTGLPYEQALHAYNVYHNITPELRRWWKDLETEIRNTHCLFTPYGRRLLIMGRIETDEQLAAIVAFRPQSTIGDKNVEVTYRSQEDDQWPHNARIILNVHDSLTCIAPFDKVKTAIAIMKKYAEQPIIVRGEPMIIPAETKWVDPKNEVRRWSDLSKVEL